MPVVFAARGGRALSAELPFHATTGQLRTLLALHVPTVAQLPNGEMIGRAIYSPKVTHRNIARRPWMSEPWSCARRLHTQASSDGITASEAPQPAPPAACGASVRRYGYPATAVSRPGPPPACGASVRRYGYPATAVSRPGPPAAHWRCTRDGRAARGTGRTRPPVPPGRRSQVATSGLVDLDGDKQRLEVAGAETLQDMGS